MSENGPYETKYTRRSSYKTNKSKINEMSVLMAVGNNEAQLKQKIKVSKKDSFEKVELSRLASEK